MEIRNLLGVEFVLGKSKKFDNRFYEAAPLLEKKFLTSSDRLHLISLYQTSWHDDGKIEDFTSCDGSCHACEFCKKMREAAEKDPTIICHDCYDAAQEERWVNVKNAHGMNNLIMCVTDYTEEEVARIGGITKYNRINSSGETPNEIYARNNIRIVKVNPWAKFGYWAKNVPPVQQAVEDLGKPDNCTLIQSSIHIGKADKLVEHFDYTFTCYPDELTTLAAIRRGASPCNGMKCITCGRRCYDRTHNSKNIAELTRISNAKRPALVAECKKRGYYEV